MAQRTKHALTPEAYAAFARMDDASLERACELSVFRATGPGGQGVNTMDSAVRLRHVPTGIVVTARETRSQYRNRQLALGKLRSILERRARPPRVRKKTKVPRRVAEQRLASKRHRSEIKRNRGHVSW